MNDALDDFLIDHRKPYKLSVIPIFIWGGIIGIGYVFMIIHWPFSDILILLGSAGFTAYGLATFLARIGKSIIGLIISIMGLAWTLYLLYGVFVNSGLPYNELGVAGFGVVLLLCYIYYAWAIRKKYSL